MGRSPFEGGLDDGFGAELPPPNRWGSRVSDRIPEDLLRRIERDGSIKVGAPVYAPWRDEPVQADTALAHARREPRRPLNSRELRSIAKGIRMMVRDRADAAYRVDRRRHAEARRARRAAARASWPTQGSRVDGGLDVHRP